MMNNKRDEDTGMTFQLTAGQKGLFLQYQLDPRNCQYNLPLTFRFETSTDVLMLQQALSIFVERHSILTSCFLQPGDEPQRVESECFELPFEVIDASELAIGAVKTDVYDKSKRAINLETGPLIEAYLYTCVENSHILFLLINHIVFDGASLNNFAKELQAIYSSIVDKTPLTLEPSRPYADFQSWQKSWLSSEDAEDSREFWKGKIEKNDPVLNLPFIKPKNHTGGLKSDYLKFTIDSEDRELFAKFAKQNRCSEYFIWLMTYYVFLYRITGNSEVVATPTKGRPDSEFDDMIGYFVNLVPLSFDISEQIHFSDLIKDTKNDFYECLMNADYPLAELARQLSNNKHRGDEPFFQTSFVWTNTDELCYRDEGRLKFEIFPLIHQCGEQSLSLEFLCSDQEINCLLKFRDDFIDIADAKKLQLAFCQFAHNLSRNFERAIGSISLLSDTQSQSLFTQATISSSSQENFQSIGQLFEDTVNQYPQKIALTHNGDSLTYSQLNAKANQLAHYLVDWGIKEKEIVAICLPRSFELIISVLAIFKVRGTYMPLDKSLPGARLQQMITNAGVKRLITNKLYFDSSELEGSLENCIDYSTLEHKLHEFSNVNLSNKELKISDSAYVIFTSGSTGQPKGVVQKHQTILNLTASQASQEELTTLQFAPIYFDVSIQEMATAWRTASNLVIINRPVNEDLTTVAEKIVDLEVERIFIPPAVLSVLVESWLANGEFPEKLHQIICAGEQLTMNKEVKSFFDNNPDIKLWNQYGPTETHVATEALVKTESDYGDQPIGKSIANTFGFIVDRMLNPLPEGFIGELVVAGDCLAKGYINDDGLTQQKFVNMNNYAGQKLDVYRTGDLVRHLNDGSLMFVGRNDSQVKVRGFRIELSEIDYQLSSLDGIETSITTVFNVNNEDYLSTYIKFVGNCKEKLSQESIVSYLSSKLPSYMVPSYFEVLESIPLTANGKVDLRELPRPHFGECLNDFVMPQSNTEVAIAKIWAEVLNIEHARIGTRSNFFHLGGHSLLVVRLINRLSSKFSIKPDIQDFFNNPTIEWLVEVFDSDLSSKQLINKLNITPTNEMEEIEW